MKLKEMLRNANNEDRQEILEFLKQNKHQLEFKNIMYDFNAEFEDEYGNVQQLNDMQDEEDDDGELETSDR